VHAQDIKQQSFSSAEHSHTRAYTLGSSAARPELVLEPTVAVRENRSSAAWQGSDMRVLCAFVCFVVASRTRVAAWDALEQRRAEHHAKARRGADRRRLLAGEVELLESVSERMQGSTTCPPSRRKKHITEGTPPKQIGLIFGTTERDANQNMDVLRVPSAPVGDALTPHLLFDRVKASHLHLAPWAYPAGGPGEPWPTQNFRNFLYYP
jgi:hypothetical protein